MSPPSDILICLTDGVGFGLGSTKEVVVTPARDWILQRVAGVV